MTGRRTTARRLPGLLFAALLALPASIPAQTGFDFESLEPLTPGEQYRQLSLLSLMAAGVGQGLLDLLQPMVERQAQAGPGHADLELDDYVKPLARIVDPERLLAGAAGLFGFARDNAAEIQARMTRIARENPILISMVDVNELAAEAIIVRNALADAIENSQLMQSPAAPAQVEEFRAQTTYLRNMMEYNEFQEELAEITDEAIVDLGGRLDAYQRMFTDEVDPELIRRRVESAEIMNRRTGNGPGDQALTRNSELLMMLILMESQIK